MRTLILTFLAAVTVGTVLLAQSSAPIVVPAASGQVPAKVTPAPANPNAELDPDLVRMLREMKAANEETLRKQAATLDQLDELQKIADQIRLYTRRG